MAKITESDVRTIITRYLDGVSPVDIGLSFGTDGSNIRYHLAKSNNLWVLRKLHAEASKKAITAKATVSKNKWNDAAEKLSARIAFLQANHRSLPTTD